MSSIFHWFWVKKFNYSTFRSFFEFFLLIFTNSFVFSLILSENFVPCPRFFYYFWEHFAHFQNCHRFFIHFERNFRRFLYVSSIFSFEMSSIFSTPFKNRGHSDLGEGNCPPLPPPVYALARESSISITNLINKTTYLIKSCFLFIRLFKNYNYLWCVILRLLWFYQFKAIGGWLMNLNLPWSTPESQLDLVLNSISWNRCCHKVFAVKIEGDFFLFEFK